MTENGESRWRFRHPLAALLPALLLGALYLRWIPNDFYLFEQDYDSAVFLYAGQQVERGAVLYRDVWDLKPPLIFYLNELGLRLGALFGSPAGGVLLLCFLFGLSFLALMYALVADVLGTLPALAGTLFALSLLPMLANTLNYTEAFALPIQALSLLLLLREWGAEWNWRPLLCAALQGALGALLFLLRPNLIGATIAYGMVMGFVLVREKRIAALAAKAVILTAGFAATAAIVLAPVVLHGATRDFLYAAFGYHWEDIRRTSLAARLLSIESGFLRTAAFGASVVAVSAGLSLAVYRPGPEGAGAAARRLATAASVLLVVEAVLSSISGRPSTGYYLTWLPAIAALAAYFCWLCLRNAPGREVATVDPQRLIVACLAVVLAGSSVVNSFSGLLAARLPRGNTGRIVQLVQGATTPSDRVLFWGSSGMELPFRLGRRPGSRVFHVAPLQFGRSFYRKIAPWVLSDLERNEPVFVIENLSVPTVPGLFGGDLGRERGWGNGPEDWDTPELKAWKARLAERYRVAFIDLDVRAVVYRRKAE